MDLTLQEDERQIAAMAAEVLAGEAALDRWFREDVDAAAEEARLRALAAGLGWIGFGAPAAAGGSEVSVVEEAVLFREAGRFLAPMSLAAGAAAARFAAADLAARIVEGEAAVGVAMARDAGRLWRLGTADGALALQVDDARLTLLEADWEPAACLDPTVPAQSAALGSVRTVAETSASAEPQRFGLLVAAQQLGLAETALAASVAYAKLREQFGRAIGSFQAVRHRCVDMAVRAERAKAQLWFAAVSLRDGAADASFQAAAAMRVCDDAAGRNARDNILLHGAIGVTAENEGHLLLKRATLWRQVLPPNRILEEIARGGGPAW
ncbi:MAG: acyl-CoA dehydrogenase family protein [Caulobacterales bacterium]|nr:acyl-CoA dehydrogenase family protein [Caulobacterales bacterium]